jgi:hypothetical protein
MKGICDVLAEKSCEGQWIDKEEWGLDDQKMSMMLINW